MTLEFLGDATNIVLVGPNGVGKSMLGLNITHQALIEGHTMLFSGAGVSRNKLTDLHS
jgi:DNA replication protein DnaC